MIALVLWWEEGLNSDLFSLLDCTTLKPKVSEFPYTVWFSF